VAPLSVVGSVVDVYATGHIEANRCIGLKQFFFGIMQVLNHFCVLSISYFKVVHSVHF
jgi:hypothetical protein